ncbi:DUF5606 domain-containing protein [uncultured Muribaculum sp.]|uniref:DUF5606 family protein n=1 Tax=uncultured Muribaculum sp. TaxID=1918613 RepID=UPI0025924C40|nr:DUF5606 domain-containing protein [uncultured Muribaculum sp.]
MLKTILAISGKPGLYKLVRQGKNMLIVESLADKKRVPAYAHDKVISLGDIAMYTVEDDIPLGDVLESLKAKTEGKPVDIKSFKDDSEVRAFFKEVLPEFDEDRVYTADIKKLFTWYNQLLAAGITDFKDAEEETAEEAAEEEK